MQRYHLTHHFSILKANIAFSSKMADLLQWVVRLPATKSDFYTLALSKSTKSDFYTLALSKSDSKCNYFTYMHLACTILIGFYT